MDKYLGDKMVKTPLQLSWGIILFILFSPATIGFSLNNLGTLNCSTPKSHYDSNQIDNGIRRSKGQTLSYMTRTPNQEMDKFPFSSGTEFSWDMPYQITSPKIPDIDLEYLKISCSDLASLVEVSNMSIYIKNTAPFPRRFVILVQSVSSIDSPLLSFRHENGSLLPSSSTGEISLMNHTLEPGGSYSDKFYLLPSISDQLPESDYIDPAFFLRILIRFKVQIYVENETSPYGTSSYETTIDCYRNIKEFNKDVKSIVTNVDKNKAYLTFPEKYENITVVECQDGAKPILGTAGSNITLELMTQTDFTLLELFSFDRWTNNVLHGYISIEVGASIELNSEDSKNTTPAYPLGIVMIISILTVTLGINRIRKHNRYSE